MFPFLLASVAGNKGKNSNCEPEHSTSHCNHSSQCLLRAFYMSDPVLNTAPELLFNPHNHHVRIEKTDVAETELPQQ